MDIQKLVIDNLVDGLANKFDELLIAGLSRKGFEFDTIEDTLTFVKENCRCVDYKEKEERVYFVNDIPFMLHSYKIEMSQIDMLDNEFKINASYGSYAYL